MPVPENHKMPTVTLSAVKAVPETWKRCGGQGGVCSLPQDGNTYRVAFGVYSPNPVFIYDYATGPVTCSDRGDGAHFRMSSWDTPDSDIAPGQPKSCYYFLTPVTTVDGATTPSLAFSDCATEGQHCSFPNPVMEMMIYRFGNDGKWVYRKGFTNDLDCRNESFAYDPAERTSKKCQSVELPPSIGSVSGAWRFIASCTGSACANFQHAITVGVTGSRSKTVTEQWSQEVSIEISEGLTLGEEFKAGMSGKVSFKYAHQQSEAVQETLSRQVTELKAVSCSSPGSKRMEMWQWGIDVDELCYVTSGRCKSTVLPYEFLCIGNPPPAYKPVCVPGDCKDEQCTICRGE